MNPSYRQAAMLKHLGRVTTLIGLLSAVYLFSRGHPGSILTLLSGAGIGLLIAALAHTLPMLANARDWQILLPASGRPSFTFMMRLVWIRESINSLLPVARIGGELVSFRLLRRKGVSTPAALASLVLDLQLTLISQLMFTMIGIGFLLAHSASASLKLASELAWGVLALTPVLLLFALVQHASPFARLTRAINRATSGKLQALLGASTQIDDAIKALWRKRSVVLRYLLVWQPLQCAATAFEIWLALRFLGAPVSFIKAIVLESLIQAVSSAAFFVPAGLGVQEGGFILIGSALGIDATTCLALAASRRIRDALIFLPGLIAWQFSGQPVRVLASEPPATAKMSDR